MRMQNDIARNVASELGDFWYDNYLERHFDPKWAKQYAAENPGAYEPRQGEDMPSGSKGFWRTYTGRKVRKYKHRNPLQWTGNARHFLEMRNRKDVRATGGTARLRILVGAPSFNFRNPNSEVDMRKDITAVLKSEVEQMREYTRVRFLHHYQNYVNSFSS